MKSLIRMEAPNLKILLKNNSNMRTISSHPWMAYWAHISAINLPKLE